jgi:ribosome recycling factor
MPAEKIVKDHGNSMDKTVEHLKSEFKSVRTGMASTGLVDSLRVEYYGTPTPVNQMASVVAPDATSIVIKPFDPSSIKDIVKAIQTSDLGLNPAADGKTVRLTIPPLSEERRKQIVTQVKQMGEQSKISVRNIRRDANKALDDEQKAKTISEDQRDKGKKDIDGLTKKYIGKIDEIIKAKSQEIMAD